MSSRDLIYLSAALGGFFICFIVEVALLRMSAKRIAALKLDAELAAVEGKS